MFVVLLTLIVFFIILILLVVLNKDKIVSWIKDFKNQSILDNGNRISYDIQGSIKEECEEEIIEEPPQRIEEVIRFHNVNMSTHERPIFEIRNNPYIVKQEQKCKPCTKINTKKRKGKGNGKDDFGVPVGDWIPVRETECIV
jgi:hypothetical protein